MPPKLTLLVQEYSGDFAQWVGKKTVDAPEDSLFSLQNDLAKLVSSKWQLASKPPPSNDFSDSFPGILAHGTFPSPGPDKGKTFTVNWKGFVPPSPANGTKYYVRAVCTIPTIRSAHAASNVVVITVQKSNVPIVFAPDFGMPFSCGQTWRASTYDGHYPDQDSLDLLRVNSPSAGQAILASADGTVIEAFDTDNEDPPYGSVVTIDHGNGWKTQYVHLDDALSVTKDEVVKRGQKIGVVGQIAGLTPHLHYVQWNNGSGVRVEFDGVPVNVHAGAKKPDGKYPTQDLSYPCGG